MHRQRERRFNHSDSVRHQHAGYDRPRSAAQGKSLSPQCPDHYDHAYGDAETKREALEGGAEALLTKPIDFGVLSGEIDSRVERAA